MADIAQSMITITNPRLFKGHESTTVTVAVFPDGRRMVTGSYDKTLRLWDLKGGTMLKKMEGHCDEVWAVAVSGNGKWIASGDTVGKLIAWNGDTGEPLIKAIQGHSGEISSLDFSPDSAVLATVSDDGTINCGEQILGKFKEVQSTLVKQSIAFDIPLQANCLPLRPPADIFKYGIGAGQNALQKSGQRIFHFRLVVSR